MTPPLLSPVANSNLVLFYNRRRLRRIESCFIKTLYASTVIRLLSPAISRNFATIDLTFNDAIVIWLLESE